MNLKLVAIDIDGTLLNSKKEITDRTKKTLAKAKANGIKVVLCTGRPYAGVEPLLKELNLEEAGDYVATYNGSVVQKADTKEAIAELGLSHDDYISIESMARRVSVPVHALDNDNIYTANQNISPYTVHESVLTSLPIKYRTTDQMSDNISIIKMMMIDQEEKLDLAISKLPKEFLADYTCVKSAPFYYEILNKKADKGFALKALGKHLNIDFKDMMAIGDNENDLAMIEFAGLGIAMGNAVPKLKAISDEETLSNDEDGVAAIIEKYL
ncbi:sugar-phosphatase [Vagococcus coleopterorum]|uniref:Sugar-phosphatase n=1 Tax=Vagococcus coleopterorum TaxID=2714946 RepID=A0A6G8AM03_9ENTE|nr:sugar-phosphatase [Vagococcus coleopterorum]QIL45982.1 sugar-phosphatase [Vagococcus coleopterorum]